MPIAARVSRGGAAQVRQQDHVLHGEERRGHHRLALEDVESRAAAIWPDWSAATSAASSTTSPRAVLMRKADVPHPAEALGVHEVARLGRGGTVQRHEVARAPARPPASPAPRRPGAAASWATAGTDRGTAPSCRTRGAARRATARAIRPMPMRPSVLPLTCVPIMWVGRQPVHGPARTCRSPSPVRRATVSSSDHRDVGGGVGEHVGRVRDRRGRAPCGGHVDVVEAHPEVREDPSPGAAPSPAPRR